MNMALPSALFSWACLLSIWLIFSAAFAAKQGSSDAESVCLSDEFSCGRQCIPYAKVCDNRLDCEDRSDESNCHAELTCSEGEFKCAKDGKCIPSTHVCNGHDDCDDGADERQLICGETVPHIVVAEGHTISKVYLNAEDGKPLVMQLLSDEMQVHTLDYFWRGQTLLAYDNAHHTGFGAKHSATGWIRKNREPTMPLTVSSVAVDQASGNLYFVDPERKMIGLLNDGMMTVVVGNKEDVYPYGVAVDARRGYLYFSDVYGSGGGIIRKCYLDGSNCIALFHTAGLPRGITVDPIEEYLYYADVRLNLIGKVRLDGTDHVVIHRLNHAEHPAYLTLDGSNCYWTYSNTPNIHYVSRKGDDPTEHVIPLRSKTAFGIVMVPPLQGIVRNRCSVKNGGCSHFCFANPDGMRCDCPLGKRLAEDGRSCVEHAAKCPANAKFLCGSGECFPYEVVCDGVANCRDASDEVNCTKTTCQRSDFLCSDNMCLSTVHICNGIPNCPNGLDEMFCGRCVLNSFSCGNGRCIPSRSMCNGRKECPDGSDEPSYLCNLVTCSLHEYPCADGRHCVPVANRCNGKSECPDGSDERGCETRCGTLGVKCEDNDPQASYEQDVYSLLDCSADPDDPDCEESMCSQDQFSCADGQQCVSMSQRCDMQRDCSDGSDEMDCGNISTIILALLIVAGALVVLAVMALLALLALRITAQRKRRTLPSWLRQIPSYSFVKSEASIYTEAKERPGVLVLESEKKHIIVKCSPTNSYAGDVSDDVCLL